MVARNVERRGQRRPLSDPIPEIYLESGTRRKKNCEGMEAMKEKVVEINFPTG